MRLGCSSWSYDRPISEGRLDQLQWLRLCAEELELDGVELLDHHFPDTGRPYLRGLRRRAAELRLTVSCVSVSNDFGRTTAEARQAEVEKVGRWLEIARFLGAPVLRVFAGWPPAEHRDAGRGEALWPEVMACLRESAAAAAERGVVLALENHDGGGFVSRPEEIERCLREVGSPWLRLCLDTGDLGDLPAIRRTVRHAVHVHAKLYDLNDEGVDRSLDWPAVVAVLRRARYRGFLCIEYEGEEPVEAAVPRGVRYLRRLLRG
jgi:sugar phosphate isomerase/epimerase